MIFTFKKLIKISSIFSEITIVNPKSYPNGRRSNRSSAGNIGSTVGNA